MNELKLAWPQIIYLVAICAAVYLIYRTAAKIGKLEKKHKQDAIGGILLASAIILGCGWVGLINEPQRLGINNVILGCSCGTIVSLAIAGIVILNYDDSKSHNNRY